MLAEWRNVAASSRSWLMDRDRVPDGDRDRVCVRVRVRDRDRALDGGREDDHDRLRPRPWRPDAAESKSHGGDSNMCGANAATSSEDIVERRLARATAGAVGIAAAGTCAPVTPFEAPSPAAMVAASSTAAFADSTAWKSVDPSHTPISG